jgi:YHS domain-containing protein
VGLFVDPNGQEARSSEQEAHMRTFRALFLMAALLLGATAAVAQSAASFNLDNGVAIEGYDPVAYFTENAAVPGDPDISTTHNGVTYYFSTEEHRELFSDDPDRYVPAYGGWCAFAAARGRLADINPEQFVVHEGTLYLNYSGWINRRFVNQLEENIEQATANWPDLAREATRR